ncbi:MAG: GTPase ObgE [Chloroflexota bacterium]
MFYDLVTIEVRAGDGGNGSASMRREKFVALGGPDGGHGSRGGHVFLRVNPQLNTLVAFSHQKRFVAEGGGHGAKQRMQGKRGADLYVDVPSGTVVRKHPTGELLGDLTESGEELLVARGGRGGRGNTFFKSSINQAPRFAERGAPGEALALTLELKLLADVGLLGKPNAGKSTLLAAVSAARPKIADYPFTTLSPNLGVVAVDGRDFVMADIPGLIEGAHAGVGLGLQFLRHVERTRLLVHLLDGASLDPAADFLAINKELALHSERLAAKPQIVALTKLDLPDAQEMVGLLHEALAGQVDEIYPISAVTGQGVRALLRAILRRLDALPPPAPVEEPFVHRPHERAERTAFAVTQVAEGEFRVAGAEIERLAYMTDWGNLEAMERFERILIARGVAVALEEAGVAVGDTVHIGDFELEWR